MKINARCFLLTLLSFFIVGIVSAQQDESARLTHHFTWAKDDNALRYEVIIEREEGGEYRSEIREFTDEPFLDAALLPGNYRLRVIPYDLFNRPGRGSEWKNFRMVVVITESVPQLEISDLPPLDSEQDKGTSEKRNDLFIGIIAEGLGYSRSGIAFGGGLVFGGSYNGMGAGISLLYAKDKEDFVFLEGLAHFRYYLFRPKNNTRLFLQAEGGVVICAYEKFELKNSITSFSGGLGVGWRFPLGTRWYVEPIVKGGYPYIFGANISAGIRFPW